MVGFMNEEAFRKTVETGFATFFSRSRNKLWLKGETSGHRLVVKEISTDCDQDALLVQVEALGPGVCHNGYQSCFYRSLEDGRWRESEPRAYDPARRLRRAIDEAETRHSQRQPGERHHRPVPPRRFQHHHQLPLVFPGHRRPRDRMHADPRAGDGALRGRRHPRCRPHRPRLGGRRPKPTWKPSPT